MYTVIPRSRKKIAQNQNTVIEISNPYILHLDLQRTGKYQGSKQITAPLTMGEVNQKEISDKYLTIMTLEPKYQHITSESKSDHYPGAQRCEHYFPVIFLRKCNFRR